MADKFVTIAGAGAKDGVAWSTAFGEAEFEHDLENHATAADIYYVMSGAADGLTVYTLDSAYDSSLLPGTAIAPISIIGVKYGTNHDDSVPVLADWGSGTDRPVFSGGANTVKFGAFYKIFNCVFTGTGSPNVTCGSASILYNCKFDNTGSTGAKYGVSTSTYTVSISCECKSVASGTAATCAGSAKFLFCYFHDCATGLSGASSITIANCIFDTCGTYGIDLAAISYVFMLNNTFYSCPIAVYGTTGGLTVGINNIIDTATDGFKWTTQSDASFFAYNHVGNSVTDMWDGVSEAIPHADNWVTGGAGADPHFTNEAGGDFSLESDSPCINTGMAMLLGVG